MINSIPKNLIYIVLISLTLAYFNSQVSKKDEQRTLEATLYVFDIIGVSVEDLTFAVVEGLNAMEYLDFERNELMTSKLVNSISNTKIVSWWKDKKYIEKLSYNVTHIITLHYDGSYTISLKYIKDSKLLLLGGDPDDYTNAMISQDKNDILWLVIASTDDDFDNILSELFVDKKSLTN